MKELIKPNQIEETYQEMESYDESCTRHCSGCDRVGEGCNRYCTGGSSNQSPIDDTDILF
jgi:hypothetical protein